MQRRRRAERQARMGNYLFPSPLRQRVIFFTFGMVPYAVICTRYLWKLYLHFYPLLAGLFQREWRSATQTRSSCCHHDPKTTLSTITSRGTLPNNQKDRSTVRSIRWLRHFQNLPNFLSVKVPQEMIRGTCGFVLEPLLCTQGMLVYQRLNQE